jgi:tetraprenyl-beta-curcumene synthase
LSHASPLLSGYRTDGGPWAVATLHPPARFGARARAVATLHPPGAHDPTPLGSEQLSALATAAARELRWGLWAVSEEMRHWRSRAMRIPDATIRDDALYAIAHKRTHADGAALFWTLPERRNLHLLRLLVAYELIWDFLDNLSERAVLAGRLDGRRLHQAIPDAIDTEAPLVDYYQDIPVGDDGGYMHSLVQACRDCCRNLPSYPLVRTAALEEANRAQVLALNHHPDPAQRELLLKDWVAREFSESQEAHWCELSGAASAPLTIHALLALAAESSCTEEEIGQVRAAYCPWVSATTTMLDSYVDQVEDLLHSDHSYISHYPSHHRALSLRLLVARASYAASSLPDGHKHAVIAASMIAMYLSKDSARSAELRATTESYIHAGGSLTRLLLPILRVWRAVYRLRSA